MYQQTNELTFLKLAKKMFPFVVPSGKYEFHVSINIMALYHQGPAHRRAALTICCLRACPKGNAVEMIHQTVTPREGPPYGLGKMFGFMLFQNERATIRECKSH